MKIYNRWGKMVYENPVPEVQWDGTIQGREVPDGVYFYVVEGVFNSITISRKGTITILR
jgi:gliding motility-associated-like protein